jgi:hypothetical protein
VSRLIAAFYVGAVVKPQFLISIVHPDELILAIDLAGGFLGVGHIVPRTTFYPCRPCLGRSPNAFFAQRRSWKLLVSAPSNGRFRQETRRRSELLTPTWSSLSLPSLSHLQINLVFSTAPSGMTPVSRYRHSSIRSFLAKATIPMRRIRLLPCPNRSSYHLVNLLSG